MSRINLLKEAREYDAEILFENVSIIEPTKRKKRRFEDRPSLLDFVTR